MTNDRSPDHTQTPAQWFTEARRCYLEEHQGCPSCRTRHCVFRSRWGRRTEYYCYECDFSTAHDDLSDAYAATEGQGIGGISQILQGLGLQIG